MLTLGNAHMCICSQWKPLLTLWLAWALSTWRMSRSRVFLKHDPCSSSHSNSYYASLKQSSKWFLFKKPRTPHRALGFQDTHGGLHGRQSCKLHSMYLWVIFLSVKSTEKLQPRQNPEQWPSWEYCSLLLQRGFFLLDNDLVFILEQDLFSQYHH